MIRALLSTVGGAARLVPLLGILGAALFGLEAVNAQEADIQPLVAARDVTVLLELGDHLYGGLDGGGMVVWPRQDPSGFQRWYAGRGLSGNAVTDIAWTGRHVWVATRGGGLTRITNIETDPEFRQYTSNLGGMDLTAVAGAVIGQSERVYYAMNGAGLGQIVDGLSGNIYTADQDGLIDNQINALALYGDELFIATPVGISRFADNAFTDQNLGLTNLYVYDLVVDPDFGLLAGGRGGIYRWDPVTESWAGFGGIGSWVVDLASGPAGLVALGVNSSSNGVLGVRQGNAWTLQVLPYAKCASVASGQDLWIGGMRTLEGMGSGAGFAYLGRETAGSFDTWTIPTGLVQNAEGVTFAADGSIWIGSHVADAVSGFDGQQWSSIYELAGQSESGYGLFNYGANILTMAGDLSGQIWISQYTSGLLRHDPAAGTGVMLTPQNSGMSGAFLLDLVVHPDGPLLLMHDLAWPETAMYDQKVDVLIDPDRWDDPGSWFSPPVDIGGITGTNRIWSAVVQSRDVVWFAVEDYGLVRWDINGGLKGPDDPLTWSDPSDDRWDDPIADFDGSSSNPRKVKGLALAPDGSIWAGGNGLVRFTYDAFERKATVLESYSEKTSNYVEGLVNGAVTDVAVDANGDAWALTATGLNRVRSVGGKAVIDAWIDLANYFANANYGLLYSPRTIAALPGITYRDLAVSPDGRRILLSSDNGAAVISVGSGSGQGALSLAGVFCYPNPWLPAGGQGLLKLGGFPADETTDGVAAVEVFNLEGQVVHRNRSVSPDSGFWDGKNRVGTDVASGMYAVKVTWQGMTTVVPLAVVR